jgi:hypothetical protein
MPGNFATEPLKALKPTAPMRRFTPVVWAAIGLLFLYWPIALLVFAVDPYDIYPWGRRSELPSIDTTDNGKFLIAAAARHPEIDLVMVGSSVSKTYTPEQIQQVFPGFHRAWNASYPAAWPADRELTLNLFLKNSHAKRFIIWIDWSYTLPAERERAQFPGYMYDSSYLNDFQMVNPDTVSAIWRLMHGAGPFDQGPELMRKEEAADATLYKAFQAPDSMRDMEQLIRENRQQISGPWRSPCDRYTAVSQQLVPELKQFSQRHIPVDLVFPAFAAAAYYDAGSRGAGTTLPEQLNLRRCVIEGTSGIPGVNIWAPDIDVGVITDLANYKNPTHIYAHNVLAKVLASIGNPAYRIDSANGESYLQHLRSTVLGYDIKLDPDPKNATLSKENPDGS